jgi:cytochrome c biogenesis protein
VHRPQHAEDPHDVKTYQEHARAERRPFTTGRGRIAETRDLALSRITALLQRNGWKARAGSSGVMVAAKKGAANKLATSRRIRPSC